MAAVLLFGVITCKLGVPLGASPMPRYLLLLLLLWYGGFLAAFRVARTGVAGTYPV